MVTLPPWHTTPRNWQKLYLDFLDASPCQTIVQWGNNQLHKHFPLPSPAESPTTLNQFELILFATFNKTRWNFFIFLCQTFFKVWSQQVEARDQLAVSCQGLGVPCSGWIWLRSLFAFGSETLRRPSELWHQFEAGRCLLIDQYRVWLWLWILNKGVLGSITKWWCGLYFTVTHSKFDGTLVLSLSSGFFMARSRGGSPRWHLLLLLWP